MNYLELIESAVYDYDKKSGRQGGFDSVKPSFTASDLEAYNELAKEIKVDLQTNCQPWFKLAEGNAGYRGLKQNRVPPEAGWSGQNTNNELFMTKSVRTDRKSADSPQDLTDAIDGALNELGYNFVHRGNALFIIGNKAETQSYGKGFRVFPIGEFQFVWNPHIMDPWTLYDQGEFHDISFEDKEHAEEEVYRQLQSEYNLELKKMDEPIDFEEWIEDQDIDIEDAVATGIQYYDPSFNEDKFYREAGQFYTNEDLPSGLQSGHEIMIRVDSYYAVYDDFYNKFIGDQWL